MTKTHCRTNHGKLIEREWIRLFEANLEPAEFERRSKIYMTNLKYRGIVDDYVVTYCESEEGHRVFRGIAAVKDGECVNVLVTF